jgi:U3 small nucleolar RNA-associated protein 25
LSDEKEVESDNEQSSDDENAEQLSNVRPYSALMQTFTAESAPQPKRRKLETFQEARAANHLKREDSVDIIQVEEEEQEEDSENAMNDLSDDNGDYEDSADLSDPFDIHFANTDDNILTRRLKSIQASQWTTQKITIPNIGKVVINIPKDDVSISDPSSGSILSPAHLKLKQKLAGAMVRQRTSFDDLERSIAPHIFNYQDTLFCERAPHNSQSLRRLVCLHALNHVFK